MVFTRQDSAVALLALLDAWRRILYMPIIPHYFILNGGVIHHHHSLIEVYKLITDTNIIYINHTAGFVNPYGVMSIIDKNNTMFYYYNIEVDR